MTGGIRARGWWGGRAQTKVNTNLPQQKIMSRHQCRLVLRQPQQRHGGGGHQHGQDAEGREPFAEPDDGDQQREHSAGVTQR